jgi:4-hydroxybenzoate polyprenyltransferase
MLRETWRYAEERSPFPLVLVLALLMYAPGFQAWPPALSFLAGLASMALFLFLIRLSDDICDIPIDRVTHPDRLLSRGALDLQALNRFRLAAAIVALALLAGRWPALLYLGLVWIVFAIFFRLKPKLPTLVHVALLNGSLFVFPTFAGFLESGWPSAGQILLGLFFWSGGFAHDLAHSLMDTHGRDPQLLNPINRIDQRALAQLSLVVFCASAGIGVLLYELQLVSRAFVVCLALMALIMAWLEVRLIRRPAADNAKPFYTFGFLYFLAPATVNLIAARW